MPTRLIDLHHHKVLLIGLGHMLQKEIHHLGIGRRKDERGHFPFCGSHGGIHIGILTNKLLWRVRPDARRSPGSSGDAQAAIFSTGRSSVGSRVLRTAWTSCWKFFFETRLVLPAWPWDDAHAEPTCASHVDARGGRWCHYALHAALRLQRPAESAQPWQSLLVRLARKKGAKRPVLARSSDIHDGAHLWWTARWLSVPND